MPKRLSPVSTHSRPKAAVDKKAYGVYKSAVSTHSRPKAAVAYHLIKTGTDLFQHTAARRRLIRSEIIFRVLPVSTHSRPKAAGPKPEMGV